MSQAPGCLGALFPWLFPSSATTGPSGPAGPLPYRLRADFLSPAEASFFRVLRLAVAETYMVCPKVRLGDLFFVPRGPGSLSAENQINRKHVDFVLCDPDTLRPVLGLELDDASHQRADSQKRDALVDAAFQAAGLRLVRVPVRASYQVEELRSLLVPESGTNSPEAPQAPVTYTYFGDPVCPTCGVAMVQRQASRGARAGQSFWGCPNYPKCRHTV